MPSLIREAKERESVGLEGCDRHGRLVSVQYHKRGIYRLQLRGIPAWIDSGTVQFGGAALRRPAYQWKQAARPESEF